MSFQKFGFLAAASSLTAVVATAVVPQPGSREALGPGRMSAVRGGSPRVLLLDATYCSAGAAPQGQVGQFSCSTPEVGPPQQCVIYSADKEMSDIVMKVESGGNYQNKELGFCGAKSTGVCTKANTGGEVCLDAVAGGQCSTVFTALGYKQTGG